MSKKFKAVYEGGTGEIEEKKSKFIAYVEPVSTEEEAAAFMEKIKKMNWDAKHNCFAAVVGANNEFSRCNDDGEPSGTAGKPMLEVLLGEGVHNVAVVVTRYFGGVLLGTGGLVRAYQAAVKEGLKNSRIIEYNMGSKIHIKTDYNGIGKIQYIIGQMGIFTIDTEYGESVIAHVMVMSESVKEFTDKVTEATAGKADIEIEDEISYGIVDGMLIY